MSKSPRHARVVTRWILALAIASAAGALAVARWPAAAPPAARVDLARADPGLTAPVVLVPPGAAGQTLTVVSPAPTGQQRGREDTAESGAGAAVTTRELVEQYIDEVCTCPDLECVAEARDHHNRHLGQAIRVRDKRGMRDAFARGEACLEELRRVSGGG